MSPLWRRAPFVLLRYRAVLAGILAGGLLVGLAASSAPLFTRAAGSAALQTQLAKVTPFGAGLEITQSGFVYDFSPGAGGLPPLAERDRAVRSALAGVPFLGGRVLSQLSGPLTVRGAGGETARVRLVARTGGLAYVHRLAGRSGNGIWMPDSVAGRLGLHPGSRVSLAAGDGTAVSLTVDGVFRDLASEPDNRAWVNFQHELIPRDPDDQPPRLVLVPYARFQPLYGALGGGPLDQRWEFPLAADGITVADARRVQRALSAVEHAFADSQSRLSRALNCSRPGRAGFFCHASTSLSTAVTLAERSIDAVSPPATLLAAVGTAVALVAVGVSGLFLVARRREEARLLFARGTAPTAFMVRTGLEALLPLLLGAGAGFGLAVLLARLFEPNGTLDGAALAEGALAAATRAAAGLLVLALVAGATFASQFESGLGRVRALGRIPWELVLAGLAAYLWLRLRDAALVEGGARQIPHPSFEAFALPIVLVAAVAALTARLVRRVLGAAGRPATRFRAGYLAVRRLRTAGGLLGALLVGAAVALGTFLYARALVLTLDRAVATKAHLANGGDARGHIHYADSLPARFPFPATKVSVAYAGATVGSSVGPQVDLMAIDPRTLLDVVSWDDRFGPPLAELVRPLAGEAGEAMPVLVVGGTLGQQVLSLRGTLVPVAVVGTASAFPGMSGNRPLVVTSYGALERAVARTRGSNPLDSASGATLVWVKGPPAAAAAALSGSPLRPFYVQTTEEFLDDPEVAAETRTFAFLGALGIAAGVLAVVGMVFYLQARQQREVVAAALLGRMGLPARTRVAALALELAAVFMVSLAVASVALVAARAVTARLDPLAEFPPAPGFHPPLAELGVLAGALLVVAVLAAALAGRASSRADVAEVMRLGV